LVEWRAFVASVSRPTGNQTDFA